MALPGGFTVGDLGSIGSSFLSNISSIQGANASAAQAKINLKNAQANAVFTRNMTALEILRQNRETYKVIGGTQADVAGNGAAMSGSSLDILRQSVRDAALDVGLVRMQGQQAVNTWLDRAAGYKADYQAAQKKKSGGILGAIGTVIGGAAGFVFSGFNPMGAVAGAQLGGSLGNTVGSL